MKDIIIFLIVMAVSLVPTILKALFEDPKKAQQKRAPKPKPEPYFPDADVDMPRAGAQPGTAYIPTSPNNDYFTYETIPDEVQKPQAASPPQGPAGKSQPGNKGTATAPEDHEKIELSINETEIYKGIIYSEILKRKYI